MKKLRLLWSYSSGVRLAALILLAVSCYALYSAVSVARSLKFAYDNYAFIRDTDLHGAYSFIEWNSPRNDEEYEQFDQFYAERGDLKLLAAMKNDPAVEALGLRASYEDPLYSMEYYDPENPDSVPDPDPILTRDGISTSNYESAVRIYTLNPDMFEFFPNLKEMLPFEDPHGVYIVGDDIFQGVGAGDTLCCYAPSDTEVDPNSLVMQTITYPGFTVEFPVEGRFGLPFATPKMFAGGSSADTTSVVEWRESPFLLMLDTEENQEWLSSVGFSQRNQRLGFYIRYKDTATKEDIARVEAMFTPIGGLVPLEPVQETLEQDLRTTFLEQLPGAILRMSIMLLCYVSLIILTVRKKQKEIAVSYICGATKAKNAGLITAFLFLITVPAGILSLVYIYISPSYAWQRITGEMLDPSFVHFSREIVPVCTVLGYFALMLLLGWILVNLSIGRRSPIQYFKEVTK